MTPQRERWEALVDGRALGDAVEAAAEIEQLEQALPSCRVEAALWREADAPLDAAALDALVERALAATEPGVSASPRKPSRNRPWLAAAAFAAAAGLVLAWSQLQRAPAVATVATIDGALQVEGRDVAVGDTIAEGETIALAGARGCIALDGAVEVCLANGARVVARELDAGARVVDVVEGAVVARLPSQREGESFALTAGDVHVRAVGTIFGVAVSEGGAVATVLEGEVAVTAGSLRRSVVRDQRAIVTRGDIAIEPLPPRDREATLHLLGEVEAPVVAVAAAPVPATTPVVVAPAPTPEPGQAAPPADPATTTAPRESAAKLLARAREQLRVGDRGRAAKTYEELVETHPRSAEARAVQVALGDLQLELGKPRAALRSYDRYLALGAAPLATEAKLGRIRAFARLGDRRRERDAIEAVLRDAGASEHRRLRERLQELDRLDALGVETK